MAQRKAKVQRDTKETQISVQINLDGFGQSNLNSGIPFLDHMLDQIARHGMLDIEIAAKGDLHVDAHHTVEDIGITLGQAFQQALGDKRGIRRYAHAYVPLDEALTRVVIDISGRPSLHYQVNFPQSQMGGFDVDLFREFFQGFVNHALWGIHIDGLRGVNTHHIAESIFKAFARTIREAVAIDDRGSQQIPSTKGQL